MKKTSYNLNKLEIDPESFGNTVENIFRLRGADGSDVMYEEWLGNAEKSAYDELIPNVEFPGNKVLKFR